MLIQDFLTNSAKKYPDKAAVIYQGRRVSYAELEKKSNALANYLLNNNFGRGDRVAIFLDNSCEYVIAYFGILKAGGVVIPLNTQMVSRELSVILSDSSPKIIISDEKHADLVKDALTSSNQCADLLLIDKINLCPSDVDPCLSSNDLYLSEKDLSMILYTSGTTGKPKGAMLSHRNLVSNAESIVKYLNLTADDKIMVVLPFYYSYGASLLTTHIRIGATLVIDNRFLYPNVVLDTMVKEEVTGFAGVPSNFAILIKKSAIRKYKFPKLRYVTQAGGAMLPAMIKEFIGILPNVKFYVMYGQTEATARLTYLEPECLVKKIGSVGKAISGVEIDILNEEGKKVKTGEIGEIVARGENIMLGYWNSPQETKTVLKTEGLFTGDLARVDEEGFIYIVSRKKDMIKSGANRISPFEIEDVVSSMLGIAECAAVGMPDEILGEAIRLFVVKDGFNITEKDIMFFCKKNLAAFKMPKEVKVVSELPKTSSGKIKRNELSSL